MAFKMNRPIIKGTSHHKASIAKAKAQSVVSQSRTKADAGLIAASNALGKSYKPSEIDFELDETKVDVAEKKALTPEEQAAKDANRAKRKAKRAEIGKNILDKGGKIVEGVGTLVGGAMLVPVAIGGGLFKVGEYVVNNLGKVVKHVSGKIKDKKAQNDAEYEAEQKALLEKQAEEDANYVGEGEIDDPENDYTKTQAYKDDLKKKQEAENEAKFRADQAANKPITLAPQTIRSLPTNTQKEKLMESTGTVATTESTDRQLDKLDKHIEEKSLDIDRSTEKGKKAYIELYEQMTYDDETDEWKVPHIEIDTPTTQKNKQDAANRYRVSKGSMELQEDGSYAPMEGTQSEYGEVWQNGEWVDTPESEKYYSPEGKKISKEKSEKLAIKQEEKGVKALRQQNIDEAREYYGDLVTTKERFAEYMRLKNEGTLAESYNAQQEQEQDQDVMIDIEEEDDIDFTDPDYVEETTSEPVVEKITNEPVVEQNSTTTPTDKPKISDFKTKKNPFGGTLTAKEQYEKALKEYYSKSAMTMRDNRIYRNAVKGGVVQQNMIKSGYIPE